MDSRPDNPPSAPPESFSRKQRIAVFALMAVIPFVVQAVYFDGGFYYDDAFHLEQSELISRGEISLWDYVTLAHGEHLIPIWKTIFYGCWTLAGSSSALMHMVVTCFHVIAAAFLFLLVRYYVSERSAAIVSILWAGAAVGGWDGPFLWIAASHLSVAVTFFLAAMWCLTGMLTTRSELWAVGMSICLLGGLLTMGSLLVLTPALLLQYWLFEHNSETDRRRRIIWLAAWSLPCLIVGLLHLVWVVPAMEKLDRPAMNLYAGLQMLGGGYAAALWNLVSAHGDPVMWGKIAGAGLIAALLLKTAQPARKVSLLIFALSLSFSVLAYMARSGWEVSHVLTWGRYRYLPTMFWCMTAGLVLDQVIGWVSQVRRDLLPWALATALVLFVVSQWQIAVESAAVFRRISGDSRHVTAPDEKTQASLIDVDTNSRFKIQCGRSAVSVRV